MWTSPNPQSLHGRSTILRKFLRKIAPADLAIRDSGIANVGALITGRESAPVFPSLKQYSLFASRLRISHMRQAARPTATAKKRALNQLDHGHDGRLVSAPT